MNSTSSTSAAIPAGRDVATLTFQVLWLCGIAISVLCFLLQITIFVLIRGSRKTDEKILAHITIARILTTSCEYYILYYQPKPLRWMVDFIFGLYFTSDFAIVCWMLLFTKHLYYKIVIVFNTPKPNLIIATVVVWLISLPFGIIAVYLLKNHQTYFITFCDLFYVVLKFIIQTLNSLIYIRVFYVASKRGENSYKNLRSMMKTALVAFLLITTTCIQILVTDIISILSGAARNEALVKTFCVINAFHVVPLTAIFIIILKGKMRQSISKTVTVRLTELVT